MLDDEIAAVLLTDAQAPPPFDPQSLPLMRQAMSQVGRTLPAPDVVCVAHLAGAIPLRLYKPVGASPAGLPLLVFLHGGGWVLGNLESHDAPCRLLADRARCAVLAVDYRLAPEHPFPAALDDCAVAFRWAVDHAEELGCDPARIAVGGESAGANLAAALAIAARDRGGAQPSFQFLVHPATDLTLEQPSIDTVAFAGLTRSFLEKVIRMYADGRDLADPLLSPLRCQDLAGLPRAFVYTVEVDPLRDDGECYAIALAQADVEVTVRRLAGLPHGFMFLPVSLSAVDRAFDLLAVSLAAAFRRP